MSGIMIATLAGLLTPQAAPHPSTLELYSAPAIRPFEPGPDFGREVGQGDAAPSLHRPPLTRPVMVGAYDGSYELARTDAEVAYDQGVASAEIRTDQVAGPLDGEWRIRDPAGSTLYELVLSDSGVGPVEGGWRGNGDAGGAIVSDSVLTLDDGASIVLERTPAGWRGRMTRGGRVVPVTVTRPD